MNEQQNPVGTAPGRREFGPSSGIDRRDRTDAGLPQRILTRRDETARAGKHYYRPQVFGRGGSERGTDKSMLVIAASLASGAALPVLFAKLRSEIIRKGPVIGL